MIAHDSFSNSTTKHSFIPQLEFSPEKQMYTSTDAQWRARRLKTDIFRALCMKSRTFPLEAFLLETAPCRLFFYECKWQARYLRSCTPDGLEHSWGQHTENNCTDQVADIVTNSEFFYCRMRGWWGYSARKRALAKWPLKPLNSRNQRGFCTEISTNTKRRLGIAELKTMKKPKLGPTAVPTNPLQPSGWTDLVTVS